MTDGRHAVYVYEDSNGLLGPVADFLVPALEAGGALVLASATHCEGIATALGARGVDVAAALAGRTLVLADADEALRSLLVNGTPDPHAFEQVVGGALDRVARPLGSPVRIYGEVVDVLCRRGRHAAALLLEDRWNELLRRRPDVSLLCGYRRNDVDAALAEVCAVHDDARSQVAA